MVYVKPSVTAELVGGVQRVIEQEGLDAGIRYCYQSLPTLALCHHTALCLGVADAAKRLKQRDIAREWYTR
ncbi:hypothetical protein KIPB_014669, partial [Kipferlia bialata]|eukprot:g14669.t1